MTTTNEVRMRYPDIVDESDDGETLGLVARLSEIYQGAEPPHQFVTETGRLLAGHHSSRSRSRGRWTGLPRLRGVHRTAAVVGSGLAALFLLRAAGYTANSFIHVFPSNKQPNANVVFISNSPPPLSAQHFRPIQPAVAAKQSGLPLAFLARVPNLLLGAVGIQLFVPQGRFSRTSGRLPPGTWMDRVRSLVRYKGRKELLVALFQIAPWIKSRPVLLGGTVHL